MKTNAVPLKAKPNAKQTINSALVLAELVLSSRELNEKHKKDVLNYVIWKITEAQYPKHKLALRSRAAHRIIIRGGKLGTTLRHEHVYTRKTLVLKLLAWPRRAPTLLKRFAVGCVVTKAEASRLDRVAGTDGWQRYRDIGLAILDVSGRKPKAFKFPK